MEARAYTEEDIKKFLKDFNNTPLSHTHEFLSQHPGLPPISKTLFNFNSDSMLVIALHALLTNDINEFKKEQLQKTSRWLSLHLEMGENTAVVKNIDAILAVYRYHSEDFLSKTYQITLPNNCYLNLPHANLTDVNLAGKDLSYSSMPFVQFTRAYLNKVNFSFGNLANAIFKQTVLSEVNFFKADLTNADLSRCDLSDANLTGSTLTGVNFNETIFKNTHFFDDSIITNPAQFKEELDRLFGMLENHPQLSMLRQAIASDIHALIDKLPHEEQAGVYNAAYRHPLLMQHRDLTTIRGLINTAHSFFAWKTEDGRVARSPIETRGQMTLAKTSSL